MRTLWRSVTVAVTLACVAANGASASPKLPLGHSGRWITDARGRVVIVHGINMVYKLPPYTPSAVGFGGDDAAFLHSIGFNAVRIGVIWKAVEPSPGVYDDAYLSRIAGTVQTLHRHGIVTLLDFHQDMYNERFQGEGAPDWAVLDDGLPAVPKLGFPTNYETMPALQHAFDHFWANSPGPGRVGLQSRYAGAWEHVASLFRTTRGLLGYELFNEPFPGTTYLTCVTASGCPAFDGQLTSFDQRVDRAIRATDSRTLVFYEPNTLFNFGFTTNVGALGDPRAGFAFHDYCLTGEAAGCSSQAKTMSNAVAYVSRTGAAALMSEYGSTNSVSDLDGMVALADRNMMPWLEWAYCGCSDPTSTGPGTVQAIVIDPRRPPRGSNLERSTLGALVEPYPQVIAGTPLGWSFDRTNRVFELRYQTARASGRGSFRRGSVTEVALPRIVYGGRYRARIIGGALLSRRGASTLTVASCRGARTISISVSPRGTSHSSCKVRRR